MNRSSSRSTFKSNYNRNTYQTLRMHEAYGKYTQSVKSKVEFICRKIPNIHIIYTTYCSLRK